MSKLYLLILLFSFSNLAYGNIILKNSQIDGILELRDPFEPPKFEVKRTKVGITTHKYFKNGVYTNLENPQDSIDIEQLQLDSLQIIGILRGDTNQARVRMKGQKDTFTLKEGMKIGSDGIELKSILPGGLVFVQKQLNLYGDTELHEIIIPIQKDGVVQPQE